MRQRNDNISFHDTTMINNTPLARLNTIYGRCQSITALYGLMDRKEYEAVRVYMKEKFDIDLGYDVPEVIKAKEKAIAAVKPLSE